MKVELADGDELRYILSDNVSPPYVLLLFWSCSDGRDAVKLPEWLLQNNAGAAGGGLAEPLAWE